MPYRTPDVEWPLDLPSIYGARFADRATFNLEERLYRAPSGTHAVLLYAIAEISINAMAAQVVVLADPRSARIAFRPKNFLCWYDGAASVRFDADGALAHLDELIIVKGTVARPRAIDRRPRAIDLVAARFIENSQKVRLRDT